MTSLVKELIANIFILLLCVLMFASIAVIFMKRQAAILKVTRTSFGDDINKINFIQISDLHIPMLLISFKRICNTIADERPNFVIITGDLCAKQHTSRLEAFLYMLANWARCPIYITFGNHDNERFKEDVVSKRIYISNMESISPFIRVLENDYEIYNDGDEKLVIGGLCDYKDDVSYGIEMKKQYVNDALDEWNSVAKRNNAKLIVASHNPDIMLFVEERKADLFVFGHTHGGQIYLPFNLEFYLFRKDKMPRKGYVHGKYRYMGNEIYISSGLGCTVIPLRFKSTAEICVHSI